MSINNDSAWAYEDGQALEAGYQKCYTDFHDIAGAPLAHNEYQAFVMALIELSRALDSDLYKVSLPPCALGRTFESGMIDFQKRSPERCVR